MPFSTSKVGVREAVLDAIKGMMVAKMDDLTAVLTSVTPKIDLTYPVSAEQFGLGDPDKVPEDASKFPFWVTIVKGGKRDGRDTEFEINASGGIFKKTISTNIYFYLHPKVFLIDDIFAQAELRERLRARFQDWMCDDVFCIYDALTVQLASQTYAPPAYDTMDEAFIQEITDGYVLKSFANNLWVQSAHFTHRCCVYGAV